MRGKVAIEKLPSVHLGEEILEAAAYVLELLFLGLWTCICFSILFLLFQWGQNLPSWLWLWMHSSQETDKNTFYGQISWNKNPFMLSFADSVSTPSVKATLGPDSLRSLT